MKHIVIEVGRAPSVARNAPFIRSGETIVSPEFLGRGDWTIEIIKRSDTAKGFVLLPRRWVVERTLAWLGRNRRLAKDFERTLESSTAWLVMASVQLMTRRLANA